MSLLVQQKSLGIETNDANIHRPEIKQEKKKKKRKKERKGHPSLPANVISHIEHKNCMEIKRNYVWPGRHDGGVPSELGQNKDIITERHLSQQLIKMLAPTSSYPVIADHHLL